MIIDFHTHIFSPRVRENRAEYVQRDPCFASLYTNPKAKLASAEDIIASMDECGIDRSVILNIGWTIHDLCRETNDYILESVARYPKRLVGFCSLQPLAGEAAVKELERCAAGGAKGIGEMRPDVQAFDLTGGVMPQLIEIAEKHRLLLLTHTSEPVGHSYDGKGKVTPETLYPFITAFPNMRLICAHWGGGLPFYALMPEVARAMQNVYFDTAASNFLYRPQVFKQVIEMVGPDKVLFGTDNPLIKPARIIKDIRSLNLSPDVESAILGGNAETLLA